MHFTDVFIKRPVFASALNLMVLLVGLVAFANMPVREYPNISSNVVTVTTNYPGASAELMAGFVTTPLENAIGGIDDIDYMYSTNVQNQSVITVYLKLGASIDAALANTMAKVTSVQYQLPPDVQNPIIAKSDATQTPSVFINFQAKNMSTEAVTDYLLRVIQPQMATLDGVSQAQIFGEREYAMRLQLDPAQMAAHDVTPSDIARAIGDQNLQSAAGSIKGKEQRFPVVADTDMDTVQEFDNLVIRQSNDTLVRFKDVGKTELGALTYDNSAYVNGSPTVTIGVIPKSSANPLKVSEEVEALLPKLQQEMPTGMTASITYDKAIFIKESIKEVYKTIIEAVIFVVAIMLLFLGSVRAVIIPLVTIPLSIIGVCGYMLAMGYTINTITLLAWVLAIGLVVDDAIVVVENVHRHITEGKTPFQAAIVGTREIGFAIIAMTLTLAAVYAPIGFTSGLTGVLFREFAFTLAGSVVISGFIALTLSPMMCSRLLSHDQSKFALLVDNTFDRVKNGYTRILRGVLKARLFVVLGALVIYGMFYVLYTHTPGELAPTEDQGVIFTYIEGPAAANIKYTEKYTAELAKIFARVPEMENYIIVNGYPSGVNSGIAILVLKDWSERTRNATQITKALFPKLWAIPGMKIIPFPPPPLPDAGFMPISFVLKSTRPEPTMELYSSISKLELAAQRNPGFEGMDVDMKIDKPQVNIEIDRNKAGILGVSMKEIATTLAVLLGEPQQNQYSMNNRSYYVIPEFNKNFEYDNNPALLNSVYVRTGLGKLIPLSNVLKITETVQPQSINHFQQLPSATLTATNSPAVTIGQDIQFLINYTKKNLPPDLQIDFSGQARQYVEATGAMEQALMFAIIFIFLVLAAQFESYRDPLIVMTTVPLSLTGAMFTLHFVHGTLNIYSQIGLITLIGLISKHGILIVEFANQLQETQGKSIKEAVIESASMRLRPILMTTAAMVLAALPLAYATGAGSESRHQIGWVIVGGMLLGTVFSLFVVPTVYTLLATKKDDKLEKELAEIEEPKPAED